jgi:putative transposase
MPEYKFEPGMHYSQQGREYVIEGRLPNNEIQVRDLVTTQFMVKPVDALVASLFDGSLEIIGFDNNYPFLKEKISKSHVNDISHLDDDDPRKKETLRRWAYVMEIKTRKVNKFTPGSLVPISEDVHKRINDPKRVPSWSSLNRWYKDWSAAGEDIRALVPAFEARGNGNHKYAGNRLDKYDERDVEKADEVADIVEKFVRSKYLQRGGPTVASLKDTIEGYINEINLRRKEIDRLPIPHVNSLYSYIKTLDPYEVDKARHGKRYAEHKWRTNQQGPRPSRPLERVQFDHTRMDMLVVDTKTRLPLGRPWLTTLIDVYTKMLLGMYISFTPPSYLAVMQCLIHAIRPKTYIRNLYPSIKHSWPAYGIPELITVDNAKEFYCKDFRDACLQLGVEVEYAPRRAAWYKGSMERFYGTTNEQLWHEMPGTTFSNVLDKKDYDPSKHAVISLDATLAVAHIWIVDIYHQKVHRGIQDIPFLRWSESIKTWPPNLPSRKEELEILLGYKDERSIGPSGIEFNSLYYNCKELGLLRRYFKRGQKAQFKFDPNDISIIYVCDKSQDKYLPVPALDQDYTKGLTLWQHLVIRNFARKMVQSQVDRASLCLAKSLIQEIVDEEIRTSKQIAGSVKLARYLNLGQPNYASLVEEVDETEMDDETELINQNLSHRRGISDIGNALVLDQDTHIQADESPQPECALVGDSIVSVDSKDTQQQASQEETGVTTNRHAHGGKTKARNGAEQKSSVVNDEDDNELDETGWGADYNLPV